MLKTDYVPLLDSAAQKDLFFIWWACLSCTGTYHFFPLWLPSSDLLPNSFWGGNGPCSQWEFLWPVQHGVLSFLHQYSCLLLGHWGGLFQRKSFRICLLSLMKLETEQIDSASSNWRDDGDSSVLYIRSSRNLYRSWTSSSNHLACSFFTCYILVCISAEVVHFSSGEAQLEQLQWAPGVLCGMNHLHGSTSCCSLFQALWAFGERDCTRLFFPLPVCAELWESFSGETGVYFYVVYAVSSVTKRLLLCLRGELQWHYLTMNFINGIEAEAVVHTSHWTYIAMDAG